MSNWAIAFAVFLFSLAAGAWLIPEFVYSLPHEDNLLHAFTGRPSFFSIGIVSNETPVHGAFYFQFLRLSALLDPNWAVGSAKLLVVAGAVANALLFLLTANLGGRVAGFLLTTLWAVSPFALWNFLQLWNLSFLPFYFLMPIGAILLASRSESYVARISWLSLALALILPATSVHQSSLLIFLALAATLATSRGRRSFGVGLTATVLLLGAFTTAYLCVSTGWLAGGARIPHGSILKELALRLLKQPRWDFAFATGARSLLTLRHLVDAVFVLLLWVNIKNWRNGETCGASKFLAWLAIASLPLAFYAYGFYLTHPTHFRERYVILFFLALTLRAAILWRAGAWPRSRSLGWFALGVAAWSILTLYVLRSPGAGTAAAPYCLAALALAIVFALRARLGLAALVCAAALHSAAYFGTRHYYSEENAGAFLTIRQSRAVAAFLREKGMATWPTIASSLVLGDFYGLVGFAGIMANPRAEDLQPVSCLDAPSERRGILLNPTFPPPATCTEGFAQALRFHGPLRASFDSAALSLESCVQTEGVGAYIFRWERSTSRVGFANYGLPNPCAEEVMNERAAVAQGAIRLWHRPAGSETVVTLATEGTTNRYLSPRLATFEKAAVTVTCAGRSITEPLIPGSHSEADFFPRPFRRHTRDLVLSPIRWSVPACPTGAVFRFSWKAVSQRSRIDDALISHEGPGSLELRLPASPAR